MMRALGLAAVLVAVFSGVAGAAPDSSLSFDAEEHAFPVHGRSGVHSVEVRASEFEGDLRLDAVDASGWDYIRIEVPGAPFAPGVYTDRPVLVINFNLGCWDPTGDITIEKLQRDGDGRITALDAAVEHRCPSEHPDNAFRAKFRYTR